MLLTRSRSSRRHRRPVSCRIGDRAEWQVIGRPFTTAAGKNAHVRLRRVDQSEVKMTRTWGAHERIGVKRSASPPGAPGST